MFNFENPTDPDFDLFTVLYSCLALGILGVLGFFFYIYWNGYRVNCWFCNEDTVVEYRNRNCFMCPNCHQYNGFTRDGGYNREIREFFDETLNPRMNPPSSSSSSELIGVPPARSNRVCERCSILLNLRVRQLADFEPMNEDNYDAEVMHFQQELDRHLTLCPDCEATVSSELRLENRMNFERRMRAEQRNRSSATDSKKLYKNNRISITSATLFILSIVNLSLFFKLDSFVRKIILQETVLPQSGILCNILSTCREFMGQYLPKNYEFTILYIGLFVELLDIFITKREPYLTNLNRAFAWIFLSLVSFYVPEPNDIVLYWTELFCFSFLIYEYGLRIFTLKNSKKFKLIRIRSHRTKDSSLQQGQELLNISGSSYKTGSNGYAPFNTGNLNQSFSDTVSTFNHDIDLSKHLNNVNISTSNANSQTMTPNPFHSFNSNANSQRLSPNPFYSFNSNANSQRLSPNPFYSFNSRPQSPMYNFCLPSHNLANRSTINETRNRNSPYPNSLLQTESRYANGSNSPINQPYQFYNFSNQPCQPFNSSRYISCEEMMGFHSCQSPGKSIGTVQDSVQSQPWNYNHIQNKINYNAGLPSMSQLWPPRPTSTNLFYNNLDRTGLNNSTFNAAYHGEMFPPFAPSSLNLSFGDSNFPSGGIINRLPNIQNNFARNNAFEQDDDGNSSTGSSSEDSSSGFISTNDFVKCMPQSLPSSRESSLVR